MKGFLKKFEDTFAAVGCAEGGEFEMANRIMKECRTHRLRHSRSDENRMEGRKPLSENLDVDCRETGKEMSDAWNRLTCPLVVSELEKG